MNYIRSAWLLAMVLCFSGIAAMTKKAATGSQDRAKKMGVRKQAEKRIWHTMDVIEGEEFTFDLPASPKRGYDWKLIKKFPDKYLTLIKEEFIEKPTAKHEGVKQWTIKAIKSGKPEIQLEKIYPKGVEKARKIKIFKIHVKSVKAPAKEKKARAGKYGKLMAAEPAEVM